MFSTVVITDWKLLKYEKQTKGRVLRSFTTWISTRYKKNIRRQQCGHDGRRTVWAVCSVNKFPILRHAYVSFKFSKKRFYVIRAYIEIRLQTDQPKALSDDELRPVRRLGKTIRRVRKRTGSSETSERTGIIEARPRRFGRVCRRQSRNEESPREGRKPW